MCAGLAVSEMDRAVLSGDGDWEYGCRGLWERDSLWTLSEILCIASGVDTAVESLCVYVYYVCVHVHVCTT